ncbi:hypothetical protein QZH41_005937 [Actinostola sp. cb2023]|nr:hypothetical protein QZH41_005937 [Actinostola sp. cb2023]
MYNPIIFHSRVKAPYNKFSNFYEVELEMPEGTFPSVEHYFQGMKFIPKDREKFTKGGLFDKNATTNWPENVSKGTVAKSAGSKSGTAKHGMTLTEDALNQNTATIRMKNALKVKFQKEPFRSLLLETENRLLVHIPMRGKVDYWTGKIDKVNGELIGENTMAKLVMEIRQELREQ